MLTRSFAQGCLSASTEHTLAAAALQHSTVNGNKHCLFSLHSIYCCSCSCSLINRQLSKTTTVCLLSFHSIYMWNCSRTHNHLSKATDMCPEHNSTYSCICNINSAIVEGKSEKLLSLHRLLCSCSIVSMHMSQAVHRAAVVTQEHHAGRQHMHMSPCSWRHRAS